MNPAGKLSLLWWAGRDLLRCPGHAVLTGACLLSLTGVVGVPLLFAHAFAETAGEILAAAPALVVRRVGPSGWRPLPARDSAQRARAVLGVAGVAPRVWGTVRAEESTATVFGVTPSDAHAASVGLSGAPTVVGPKPVGDRALRLEQSAGLAPGVVFPPPLRGQVVVGAGLGKQPGDSLRLAGVVSQHYTVAQQLAAQVGMVAHDVVFLHVDDARQLLGLGPDEASDLAIDVFHPAETEAILPDLSQVFGFPVRIERRSAELKRYAGQAGRRGSLVSLMLVPAVLGMVLLIAAATQQAQASRWDVALLKALGWTTRDVVMLCLLRALLVGIPAVALGLAASSVLTFTPGLTWFGRLVLGLPTPPQLALSPSGATLVLLEVWGLVLVPYMAAILLPAARCAGALPDALITEVAR
ncbi:ABC transporter permease [Myxococcota bacterium]